MSRQVDSAADLVVEERFAIVPEWLLDAEIGDAAVRLYAVLLRYGQSSGARMPSRATLARRLRKRSTDSVDRAMKELVGIGAVRVEHRYDGAQRLTNAYHVRTSRPGRNEPPTPDEAGSRKSAATPAKSARGGRTDAGRVAADSGHDPEHLTQSTPSSTEPPRTTSRGPAVEEDVAAECGIDDWPGFVAEVQQDATPARRARHAVGRPLPCRSAPARDPGSRLAGRTGGAVAVPRGRRSEDEEPDAGRGGRPVVGRDTGRRRPPATGRICGRWSSRCWSATASASSCSSRPVERSRRLVSRSRATRSPGAPTSC